MPQTYATVRPTSRGAAGATIAGRRPNKLAVVGVVVTQDGKPYAAFPPGRTFGKSMDSSAFIFASAESMIHICEL